MAGVKRSEKTPRGLSGTGTVGPTRPKKGSTMTPGDTDDQPVTNIAQK